MSCEFCSGFSFPEKLNIIREIDLIILKNPAF